jgi:glutamine---fructose-6-phosphate transaminase (isomerizing)
MCGIIAYIGSKKALAILIAGLKRLEYRGYDSAGVAVISTTSSESTLSGAGSSAKSSSSVIKVCKKVGKVSNLESASTGHIDLESATIGIAHTRWATHGTPSDINSHPHSDSLESVAVVHNGIVENFVSLRKALQNDGCVFKSETDSEIFPHLIAMTRKKNPSMDLASVVCAALQPVEGAFGICVVFADQPDLLIGARKGSPLLLGVGDGEFYLASDASALLEHTKMVEYIQDHEIVVITRSSYTITSMKSMDKTARAPNVLELNMTLGAIEKSGYPHFMLKEIFEQPSALRNAMRGRVLVDEGDIKLGGLSDTALSRLTTARRIILAACGTSFHSAQVGKYLIEHLARVLLRSSMHLSFDIAIQFYIQQTMSSLSCLSPGETADTLAAVREAKSRNVLTIGCVNVVGSSIAREVDSGVYLHCGPEIGVASTKAFTGQVLLLAMIGLKIAKEKGVITGDKMKELVKQIDSIPDLISKALLQSPKIYELSKSYRFASSFLFLVEALIFQSHLEGALKAERDQLHSCRGLCSCSRNEARTNCANRQVHASRCHLPSKRPSL